MEKVQQGGRVTQLQRYAAGLGMDERAALIHAINGCKSYRQIAKRIGYEYDNSVRHEIEKHGLTVQRETVLKVVGEQ